MTEKGKDVAVKDKGALAASGGPRRGFEEGTAREDLLIPRAKLLQALSPEVVEGAQTPDNKDLKSGMIINSLTRGVLPVEFVPIFKFTNWIRFNPRDDKSPDYNPEFEAGAIIWRSSDPLDPKVKNEGSWDGDKPPLATKFLNFFSYFPGHEMPIILSFSKTSYRAGKQLLSLAQFSNADMFSRKYKLGTKLTKNDIGSFYVFTIEPCGMPVDEDLAIAEKLWNDFAAKAKDIQVHDEAPAEDAAGNGEAVPF